MYKLLFDSDALIKIAKIGLLSEVTGSFDVVITEEVYGEAVTEGKKRLYEDADEIENCINLGQIKVTRKKHESKIDKTFGKGETSVLQAYDKGNIIMTDDLNFASYLLKENIRNLSSAHLIVILLKKKKLGINEANSFLERLKQYIRKELYNLVKSELKGE